MWQLFGICLHGQGLLTLQLFCTHSDTRVEPLVDERMSRLQAAAVLRAEAAAAPASPPPRQAGHTYPHLHGQALLPHFLPGHTGEGRLAGVRWAATLAGWRPPLSELLTLTRVLVPTLLSQVCTGGGYGTVLQRWQRNHARKRRREAPRLLLQPRDPSGCTGRGKLRQTPVVRSRQQAKCAKNRKDGACQTRQFPKARLSPVCYRPTGKKPG